ncbi:MAG: phosphotransferase [Verrucomicrobiota bacterium]
MNQNLGARFRSTLLRATSAAGLEVTDVIQELWSGYGKILRVALNGSERKTVVVKHVTMPQDARHPRGWNSNLSHERKVFSYRVETEWYRRWSERCDETCRIPGFLAFDRDGDEVLLVLEDLDSAGFPARLTTLTKSQINACLRWLAEFHATFLGATPKGLWETGTYWHLETRPEELNALDDEKLKNAAGSIDEQLRSARWQTLVHGDAKLANFCFSSDGSEVAALDFQYVGGGCGMKDVAYFIGSCLDEANCEAREDELLDAYFASLRSAIERRQPTLDADGIEAEWRKLFPVAWTDFHRFLKGWCPGHWKINSYSERLAREVIATLT